LLLLSASFLYLSFIICTDAASLTESNFHKYKVTQFETNYGMQIGWNHLKDDIALMGADNGFTALVWPLGGEDPDDAFSSVPYEKVTSPSK
jgi:hypothetical protein